MEQIKDIIVDEKSPLFDKKGMFYKEFPSDFRQIRYFTLLIVQKAPPEIKEINLLEQQVSEILKNAIKHGNGCDVNKKVKVWFSFDDSIARLIALKRPIWLLDEPTSALDVASQGRLANLMRAHLAGGGMIIAAAHGPIGLDHPRELQMGPQ